jgi:hypothetical protein
MTKEVEKAERDLNNLEQQRVALFDRAKELSKQREAVAHAALVGDDGKAKTRLKEINLESMTTGTNIESVDCALVVARSNLGAAQAAAAGAADIDRAKQVAALNAKLKEELDNADDAFSDAIGSVLAARTLLQDIHALGVTSPTDQMFRINSVAVIKTVLQNLPQPWVNDFEFMRLAPSQKKSFKPLAEGWRDQIANQIAARLGSETKDERAA